MANEETKTQNEAPTPKGTDASKAKERIAAIMAETASRIADAHSILIALSSDPSVDELAAAIGLSICLDRVGKRATAIYSGATPDALEFLKPEETFETTADSLQDFVIAINKDKADHLRYKLDGDYVRIFVTPYKSRIAEEDLEFSYGDFNIDLVLALDVANGIDLDNALREHGRIMHDASIINITTGNPGKFGEIEWSDKSKSSVSEMVAELLYSMKKIPVEKEEATAFLTGIVAATNRFSNASTTADTMQMASRLMESGANQQLVTENITGDTENQMFSFNNDLADQKHDEDPASLDINHEEEETTEEDTKSDANEASESSVSESSTSTFTPDPFAESTSSAAAESAPEPTVKPAQITPASGMDEDLLAVQNSLADPNALASEPTIAPEPAATPVSLSPSADFAASIEQPTPSTATSTEPAVPSLASEGPKDYSQMLEAALAEDTTSATPTPGAIISPDVDVNPAMTAAPVVPTEPEVNNVPSIDYEVLPVEGILPPPPTPSFDANTNTAGTLDSMMPPTNVATPAAPDTPAAAAPAPANLPADTPTTPATPAPDAFKIPGI